MMTNEKSDDTINVRVHGGNETMPASAFARRNLVEWFYDWADGLASIQGLVAVLGTPTYFRLMLTFDSR